MSIYEIFKLIINIFRSKPMKSDKTLTTFDEIIQITGITNKMVSESCFHTNITINYRSF